MPTDQTSSVAVFDRRKLLQGAGAIGFAAVLPSSALAAISAGTVAQVQAVIDRWVAEKRLPGAIVVIGEGSAPPVYIKGGTLGFDTAAKVDEHTIWQMASLTKPVTAMATMLLIAEGKLGLDQPIGEILPAFAKPLVRTEDGGTRTASAPITVRHLMTHTSGIGSVPVATAAGPPAATSLAQYTEQLADQPLVASPGAKYNYASGLEVAARIVEIVGAMPFETFLEQYFFQPLGMRSTGFWVREADRARLATRYSQREGALVAGEPRASARLLSPPDFPRASGGMVSTAHDYDRFLAMLMGNGALDGVTVMPASAVRMGLSNLLPPGVDMSGFSNAASVGGYGAGGYVYTVGPSLGSYGWGGASGTAASIDPRAGTRLSSYTNIGLSPFSREIGVAITGIEGIGPEAGPGTGTPSDRGAGSNMPRGERR